MISVSHLVYQVHRTESLSRARDAWIDRRCAAAMNSDCYVRSHYGTCELNHYGQIVEDRAMDAAGDEWDAAYARLRELIEKHRRNPEYVTPIEAAYWEGVDVPDGHEGELWAAIRDALMGMV